MFLSKYLNIFYGINMDVICVPVVVVTSSVEFKYILISRLEFESLPTVATTPVYDPVEIEVLEHSSYKVDELPSPEICMQSLAEELIYNLQDLRFELSSHLPAKVCSEATDVGLIHTEILKSVG